MKFITEVTESVTSLVEETSGKKNFYIEGIFMQADTPNRNRRIYPMGIMESAVEKYQGIITAKRAMGELNHPPTPNINLDKVSHIVESLKFDGNNVIGRAKLLDTPMGIIAQKLIEGGAQLGVSSRGLGSVKQMSNGISEVQDDFYLGAIDIVGDPSAPDAFVNGIMESTEWEIVNGKILQVSKDAINEAVRKKELESKKVQIFENFLKMLSQQR